ncbi:IS1182 family transposase [archaeon]|nr:IS1182 family transposase [archaeon]
MNDHQEISIIVGHVEDPLSRVESMTLGKDHAKSQHLSLKLLLYGYSYGFRSSRKLERATYHNVSFIWLMGGLKPDHKTIAEFRRRNKAVLKDVLKTCARLCIRLGLIAGNTLFVDSTRVRANASIKNTWTKEKCQRALEKIEARIEAILSECDAVDEEEENQDSLVKMRKELKDKKVLKAKVENISKDLNQTKKKSINTTDSECTRISGLQGSHAGYSLHSAVDERNGLLVNSDVVGETNDLNQFAEQVNQANEILQKKCDTACADSGYAYTRELEKIDKQAIKVIVPSQKQASGKKSKPFDKSNFQYDSRKDSYLCPEGRVLTYSYTNNYEGHSVYMMRKKTICQECPHFGVCTTSKQGRTIARLINEEVKQKLEAQYEQSESQTIYKLRQQKAELPFGHIKRNLKVDAFLLRGLDGVKAEASLLASCFNIRRMITLIGALALIKKLKDLASSRGTSLLHRRNITSSLRGLRNVAYSKEENSNQREKTLINRVLKVLDSRFLSQRAFLKINYDTV